MAQSIFSIERRINFPEEFKKILLDLVNTNVKTSLGSKETLYEYLDYCIKYWPFRCGSLNISSYMESMNLDNFPQNTDKYNLLYCELIINLLNYAPEKDRQDYKFVKVLDAFGKTDIARESERILQNLEYILEQGCNMYVRVDYIEKYPKYIISKRDADVDSALESAPELNDYLLGYLDVRNENDLEYKKNALIAIYHYLEPQRSTFKNVYSGKMCETFFATMNKFNIRHNKDDQIVLPEYKQKDVYDKLFKIGLCVVRSKELLDYQKELEAMYK